MFLPRFTTRASARSSVCQTGRKKSMLMVTHDREMVDKMRRRVLALEEGRLVRDQAAGGYTDESTTEFAVRIRAEMGVGDEGRTNGETVH